MCVLAVNRILGGLNATWQEQSVAYFKAPQEMDTNKKSLFSGQLFFLHIQQPNIHENITYICFVQNKKKEMNLAYRSSDQ